MFYMELLFYEIIVVTQERFYFTIKKRFFDAKIKIKIEKILFLCSFLICLLYKDICTKREKLSLYFCFSIDFVEKHHI